MALPAGSGRHQLHHTIIGEDAEHDLHLRLELIIGERLEQNLFGMNVDQPSSSNGIVALRRNSQSDGLTFEASIAEQLGKRICAHCLSFPQVPYRDVLEQHERRSLGLFYRI